MVALEQGFCCGIRMLTEFKADSAVPKDRLNPPRALAILGDSSGGIPLS